MVPTQQTPCRNTHEHSEMIEHSGHLTESNLQHIDRDLGGAWDELKCLCGELN